MKLSDWLCHQCALIRRTGPRRSAQAVEEGKQRSVEHKHLPQSPCFLLPPGAETTLQAQTHMPTTRIARASLYYISKLLLWNEMQWNWWFGELSHLSTMFPAPLKILEVTRGLSSFTTSSRIKSWKLALYLHLITLTLVCHRASYPLSRMFPNKSSTVHKC